MVIAKSQACLIYGLFGWNKHEMTKKSVSKVGTEKFARADILKLPIALSGNRYETITFWSAQIIAY